MLPSYGVVTMSKEDRPNEIVEETDSEEATIMVADPEDYQKSKKLKAIHQSKKRVREVLQNKHKIMHEVDIRQRTHWQTTFANAISMYGLELMPLVEDAMERGVIEKDDLDVDSVEPNIHTFIEIGGGVVDDDTGETRPPEQWEGMNYYQQLQRIERKLGLGLDLEEEQTPAEI